MKKHPDYLGYTILILLFIGTIFTQQKLEEIKTMLAHQNSIPKIEIQDTNEFKKLCEQLMTQWDANGYAFYILQPKGINKTHKEKAANSEAFNFLPIRAELENKTYLDDLHKRHYDIVPMERSNQLNIGDIKMEGNLLVIPIFEHNNIIIGELVMFYDGDITLQKSEISVIINEAQILTELLN
jgi:hypothetical protein